MSLREILLEALAEEDGQCADREVKTLSLRLLTRVGIMTKNPETLLMVSSLQKKL